MSNREELVAMALQQRIAEIVAEYEMKIALLRSDLTLLVEEKNQKEEAIKQYSSSLGIDS